jgi:cell division protein FtsB
MPPAADAPPRSSSAKSASTRRTAGPAASRLPAPKQKPGWARRLLRPGLALVTLVLVADALVGENGWFERGREQERLRTMTAERDRLQHENAVLAERARRLKAEDPALVEDLARGKLQMLKPGEVLFVESTNAAPVDPPATRSSH